MGTIYSLAIAKFCFKGVYKNEIQKIKHNVIRYQAQLPKWGINGNKCGMEDILQGWSEFFGFQGSPGWLHYTTATATATATVHFTQLHYTTIY